MSFTPTVLVTGDYSTTSVGEVVSPRAMVHSVTIAVDLSYQLQFAVSEIQSLRNRLEIVSYTIHDYERYFCHAASNPVDSDACSWTPTSPRHWPVIYPPRGHSPGGTQSPPPSGQDGDVNDDATSRA